MAEKERRMIDLSKVRVQQVNGEFTVIDYSKDVASATYNNTQDLETAAACLELFKTGKCPYSENVKEHMTTAVNALGYNRDGVFIPMGIVFKKAILDAMG